MTHYYTSLMCSHPMLLYTIVDTTNGGYFQYFNLKEKNCFTLLTYVYFLAFFFKVSTSFFKLEISSSRLLIILRF